jgi:phage gpG-like protein
MRLKVSVSATSGIKKKIKDKIEAAVDKSFRKEMAEEIVEDIQINTRRGYGIKDGKRIELAPLKHPSTTEHRHYLERGGNATARPYATDFSNLSMSGQLVDSVGYELDSDGSIVIEAKGFRKPYRKLDGSPSKAEPISNEELSRIHHKGNAANNLPARPFIGLRDEMKRRIIIKLRERIRRGLEVIFNVKKGS